MYSLVSLLLLYYFVVVVWMFGVPHNVIFHPHHQTSPSSSAWLCKRFVCCAPNPVVMSIYYISLSVSECVSIYYMSVCNGICGEACSVRGHLLLNMHHRLKKKWCTLQLMLWTTRFQVRTHRICTIAPAAPAAMAGAHDDSNLFMIYARTLRFTQPNVRYNSIIQLLRKTHIADRHST